jgi:predicted adenine nucleotide alpha hydrolase (AANH) superfamily ATPase
MAGYSKLTTTLTVSPHKDPKVINSIGRNIADEFGVKFLEEDFKKKDGYKRSCDLSREYGLYRQKYCGCVYSIR